jgi:8-oxo-dGTP diphosphatase
MQRPAVGVGVIVVDNVKNPKSMLMSVRKSALARGLWQNPGGHLEYGESPEQCAIRELREETGLIATSVRKGPWINSFFQEEGLHYLSVFIIVDAYEGQPQNLEPDKCEDWVWVPLSEVPKLPTLGSLKLLMEQHDLRDLVLHYGKPGFRFNVGVLVFNDNKRVLLRRQKHAPYLWVAPCGEFENDQAIKLAAGRIMRSQTGLSPVVLRKGPTVLGVETDSRERTVTHFMINKDYMFDAQNNEPDEYEDWHWVDLSINHQELESSLATALWDLQYIFGPGL